MAELSEEQCQKAKEAIEFLSSLPANNSSTAVKQSDRVIEAADKAIAALTNHSGSRPDRKRKIKEEVSNLFFKSGKGKGKAAGKGVLWRHKFVCLARKDQSRIPTSDIHKDELLKAGLGAKEIEFENIDIDSYAFRQKLFDEYPKLEEGGGFMFYKCRANTRDLEPLSQVCLSSPRMLKERAGQSRTYILPLQRNLNVTPVFDLPEGPLEKCLTCEELIPVSELLSHIQKEHESQVLDLTGNSDTYDTDEDLPSFQSVLQRKYFDKESESLTIEEDMLQTAVECSLQSVSTVEPSVNISELSPLQMEINSLSTNISTFVNVIEVRRKFVLQDALKEASKKKFDFSKQMKVKFIGEGSIDSGGPKREFFRLFAQAACEKYFGGDEGRKYMVTNVFALQSGDYYNLGVYTVISILQGGCGLPCLSKPFYNYLTCGKYTGVSPFVNPEELSDKPQLKFVIEKLHNANNDDEIRASMSFEEAEVLLNEAGIRKPLCLISVSEKQAIINALLDYYLMIKVKAEMDQFKDGLQVLGFLDNLQKNPQLWQPYFMDIEAPLTTEILKGLFQISFSPLGSNYESREQQSYVYFGDLLDECEDGDVDCSLRDVLAFTSGSGKIPPVGFSSPLTLTFLHSSEAVLPTSSTCDMTLRLPTVHTTYSSFKEYMILGIKSNDGFGGV